MKRLLIALSLAMFAIIFTACGDSETTDKPVKDVETAESEETSQDSETASEENDGSEEEALNQTYDEVIVDNENVKISLKSVVEEKDDIFGDSVVITFEVENKRDDTIEVQAREVSADGKMVDESLVIMSTEVASGKLADAKLTIQAMGDQELPPMEDNIELKLHIFSWDDYDYSEDHPVVINFD